jgi:RNA polymerase sigma-70 factor (ECF subfamily)
MDKEQYPEINANIMKHRGSLFAFIFSFVRDFHAAEDIFQETCVIIWSKADVFEPGTNFLAWARAIAIREIRAGWKKKKRAVPALTPETIETLSEVWSERFADEEEERESYEERRRVLYECIGLLKGRSRDALVGFYEKGMACADIARRHKTSLAAIHMLLKRVREKLFECVQTKLGMSV